jgi:hypothetical protein
MYFVSEVLTGSKRFYSEVEKICYVVIMSARKLRHYFEAHTIKVLTNQPLNDIFGNRDSYGRINKWATELSEHVVGFEKHSTIKSQIIANFVAEWMEPGSAIKGVVPELPWLVHCDRAWGQQEPEQPQYILCLRESSYITQQDYNSTAKPISAPITLQSMRLSSWGSAN